MILVTTTHSFTSQEEAEAYIDETRASIRQAVEGKQVAAIVLAPVDILAVDLVGKTKWTRP